MFPTRLQTGFDGFFDDGRAHSIEEVIECILYVILKDSLTKMLEFYTHLGLTNDDTEVEISSFKQFLKLSCLEFANCDIVELNMRVQDAIERYMYIRNNFEEELLDIDSSGFNEPNQPVEWCNCRMCETMAGIHFNWESWRPTDTFLQILKRAVDNFDMESAIEQFYN